MTWMLSLPASRCHEENGGRFAEARTPGIRDIGQGDTHRSPSSSGEPGCRGPCFSRATTRAKATGSQRHCRARCAVGRPESSGARATSGAPAVRSVDTAACPSCRSGPALWRSAAVPADPAPGPEVRLQARTAGWRPHSTRPREPTEAHLGRPVCSALPQRHGLSTTTCRSSGSAALGQSERPERCPRKWG